MRDGGFPNSLRLLLIILTVVSFLPQLQRLQATKDSSGISISYVLLNLIVATEQFTLEFYLKVIIPVRDAGTFNLTPLSIPARLDFAQITTTCILFQVLFARCLKYLPGNRSAWGYGIVYALFLCLLLIPELYCLMGATCQFWDMFGLIHAVLINPIVAILGIFSVLFQVPQIRHHTGISSLSALGLAAQAAVFALVAVSWIWRVVYVKPGKSFISSPFINWYLECGWPVVANGVFAAVQFILFLLAWYYRGNVSGRIKLVGEETEPLLS